MAQPNKLELKENEGKAFLQEKEEDWHSDFSGQVLCPDGIIRYLNVWKNVAQNTGKEWIKITFGGPIKDEAEAAAPPKTESSQEDDEFFSALDKS